MNKDLALRILKGKLLEIAQSQKAAEIADIRGEQVAADFGSQIRNYVLHPYKLVKDTRSGCEATDVNAVLDGDLDAFLSAHLRQQAAASA